MTGYPEPRLLPCGDLAVSVELADEIDREVNARVLALEYLIQQKGVPGVTETLPTYRALLVYFDPAVIGADELGATLRALAAEARPEVLPPARTVELPCCYGGELGFELEAAAAKLRAGAGGGGAAARRRRLSRLLRRLHPRPALHDGHARADQYPSARQSAHKTPPGSVAIGGVQCCIYSVESPGGFWVLGRTPARLYDPAATDPILLRAGDHVRFRAIERAEYDAIAAQVAAGTWRPRISSAALSPLTLPSPRGEGEGEGRRQGEGRR